MKRNIVIRSAAVLLVLVLAVIVRPFASAMLDNVIFADTNDTEAKQSAAPAAISDSPEGQSGAPAAPTAPTDPDTTANPAEATEDGIIPPGDVRNDPDYIKLLKTIYSQDDIDRLYAPRQWVIMPNVVGMTASQALAAMHAVGLVGRVIYEDHNYAQGICFAQDALAGKETNTDATIFIWVQTVKDSPDVTPTPVTNMPLTPEPSAPAEPADPFPIETVEPTLSPQPSPTPETPAPTDTTAPSDAYQPSSDAGT